MNGLHPSVRDSSYKSAKRLHFKKNPRTVCRNLWHINAEAELAGGRFSRGFLRLSEGCVKHTLLNTGHIQVHIMCYFLSGDYNASN